ncbi:MAG: hypothetical protein JW993_20365 [Sedimentisphaerales bacterium]|nr:hypothetical protein [Sedimentisphaerales bacterium]
MKLKRAVSIILVFGVVLALLSVSQAVVDLRRIEEVTKKNILTPADLQIIDEFMNDAVTDIVRTEDFTAVSKTRSIILNHRADKAQPSAQAQYAQQFSESAYKQISEALAEAEGLPNESRRYKVITNLLILVENLEDPRLVELAIGQIRRANAPARYWAVRAATDAELWAKLSQNQATASRLAATILAECSQVAATSSAEVLRLMADFAGRFDTPAASALLVKVADARIARYADWTVDYELVDGAILKHLCDRLAGGGTPDPELARRFAQLYSFAMQRYIKGKRLGVLKEASQNYLVTLLVQTEQNCLGELLAAPQATITRLVTAGDLDGLQAEHDRLLGAPGRPGVLPARLSFSYTTQGESTAAPVALPDPPGRPTQA